MHLTNHTLTPLVHGKCPDPPECNNDPSVGNFTWYLNQDHIQEALGFTHHRTFAELSYPVNRAYDFARSPYKLTTDLVAKILDGAYDKKGVKNDIRLLVLQGNEDYIVNTPGQVWRYDGLRWSGQADFRLTKHKDLPEHIGATGFWKGSQDGKLAFIGVDGGGHTVPGDVREGSYRILQDWLAGGWKETTAP